MTDPYAAPQSSIEITEGIVDALRSTRPWVLFIAILCLLCTFAMFLGCFFMVLAGIVGSEGEGVMLLVMAAFYGVLGGVYVLPAWWLVRYFSAIGGVVAFQDTEHVEKALVAQRNFWRGVGIMVILAMLLYFGAIVVAVVAAVLIPMF